MPEIVRDINKLSNNVMAQQLFLTLGATQRGAGTPEAAREVLRQWLRGRAGSAAAASVIVNGSGLSRDGRLSARTLGQPAAVGLGQPGHARADELAAGGRRSTARCAATRAGRAAPT